MRSRRHAGLLFAVVAAVTIAGCKAGEIEAVAGTQIRMGFARSGDLYAGPIPSVDLEDAGGALRLDGFPNPGNVALVADAIRLGSEDAGGASLNAGIFFSATAGIDPASLPSDPHASVDTSSSVFLVDVTPGSPSYLERHPVEVAYRADGGRFGADHLLVVMPVQGLPLRPDTTYAAVVTRAIRDTDGRALGVSKEMVQLRQDVRPPALAAAPYARYRAALSALDEAGVARDEVAGLAVLHTMDPRHQIRAVFAHALAAGLPQPNAAFTLRDVYPDLCVYYSTIDMPTYQAGDPPYTSSGGRWAFDGSGVPQVQATEEARFWITVPRGPVPAAGLPVVVFIRTGSGGDRALVDRGTVTSAEQEPVIPGEGPGLGFARAGFAGVQVDGPHGGLRNVTGGDEQFLMFNMFNAAALRDNIRQSAVEIMLLAHVLESIRVDASGCPGVTASDVTAIPFDLDHLGLWGHSMGATIAPIVLALEPRYGAVILSGAGGSWIENVLHKRKPLRVHDFAEILLNYAPGELRRYDPVLSLVQWAADSADPLAYLRHILRENPGRPPHVLMLQGIIDNYILPPIANATSLGLGLDLAGTAHDATHAGLTEFTDFATYADLAGVAQIALPAAGNRGDTTAVVVQHLEDGIQDGHEVAYQQPLARAQYECFLRTWLAGGPPRVPADASDLACQ